MGRPCRTPPLSFHQEFLRPRASARGGRREAGGLGCSDRLAGGGHSRSARATPGSAWTREQRLSRLHLIANTTRFVILDEGRGSQHGFAGAWAEPAAPVRRHAGAARLSRARRRELRGSVKIFRHLLPRFELACAGSDQWHFVRLYSLHLINLAKSQPFDLYLDFARDYFLALGLTRARRHGMLVENQIALIGSLPPWTRESPPSNPRRSWAAASHAADRRHPGDRRAYSQRWINSTAGASAATARSSTPIST